MSNIRNIAKSSFKDVNVLKLAGDFFLEPRMISNIDFPKKGIGEIVFSSLNKNALELENKKNIFYKLF